MPPASTHDNGSPDGLPFFVAPQQSPQQPVIAAASRSSNLLCSLTAKKNEADLSIRKSPLRYGQTDDNSLPRG